MLSLLVHFLFGPAIVSTSRRLVYIRPVNVSDAGKAFFFPGHCHRKLDLSRLQKCQSCTSSGSS